MPLVISRRNKKSDYEEKDGYLTNQDMSPDEAHIPHGCQYLSNAYYVNSINPWQQRFVPLTASLVSYLTAPLELFHRPSNQNEKLLTEMR